MPALSSRNIAIAAALGFMGASLGGCGGGGGKDTTTVTTTLTTTTITTVNYNCLCLFDVDRTLTAGQHLQCENTTVVEGITDNAYGGGTLKLSHLALHLNETFCHKCHHGIITRGDVSGEKSMERDYILKNVINPSGNFTLTDTWQQSPDPSGMDENMTVSSSLIFFSADGKKQNSAKAIVKWFATQGWPIPKENVHFFDDRQDNVEGFEGTGMNAMQVACAARDPTVGRSNIGKCGGVASEVVEQKGVHPCGSRQQEEVATII